MCQWMGERVVREEEETQHACMHKHTTPPPKTHAKKKQKNKKITKNKKQNKDPISKESYSIRDHMENPNSSRTEWKTDQHLS